MSYTNPMIDQLLQPFQQRLGGDYTRYYNHVSRVYLACLHLDHTAVNVEKYAIAAVFHDIGIWTHHTIDYLVPSIEEARRYLQKINRTDWEAEVTEMIWFHHKTSRYTGPGKQTVETFRKADYIDVTLGLFTYGMDRAVIAANQKAFPNKGFHRFLLRKIIQNFFRHPLRPLPMFTR